MQTKLISTNEYYREILDEADPAAREQLFIERFIRPWKPMMDILAQRIRDGATGGADELAGARAWNWLLPDQTDLIADLLAKLEAVDAWTVGGEALCRAAACLEPFQPRIPFDAVTGWLVLADPTKSNGFEHGYTGAMDWMQPRFLGQFWDPNEDNLPRLPGLLAHEMHHLVRTKVFPFGPQTSVADYIIIEGTAEAFAASLFGERSVGYFITEFDPGDFETSRRMIGQNLHATGFDVIRSYIFGDALAEQSGYRPAGGMPTYGGYTVGYHVVRAFLERTGKTIAEATFLPTSEIVEGSGFFEAA